MADNVHELKDRLTAKQKQLEARWHELKADSASTQRQTLEEVDQQLTKIKTTLNQNLEELSDAAAGKLNDWLKKLD